MTDPRSNVSIGGIFREDSGTVLFGSKTVYASNNTYSIAPHAGGVTSLDVLAADNPAQPFISNIPVPSASFTQNNSLVFDDNGQLWASTGSGGGGSGTFTSLWRYDGDLSVGGGPWTLIHSWSAPSQDSFVIFDTRDGLHFFYGGAGNNGSFVGTQSPKDSLYRYDITDNSTRVVWDPRDFIPNLANNTNGWIFDSITVLADGSVFVTFGSYGQTNTFKGWYHIDLSTVATPNRSACSYATVSHLPNWTNVSQGTFLIPASGTIDGLSTWSSLPPGASVLVMSQSSGNEYQNGIYDKVLVSGVYKLVRRATSVGGEPAMNTVGGVNGAIVRVNNGVFNSVIFRQTRTVTTLITSGGGFQEWVATGPTVNLYTYGFTTLNNTGSGNIKSRPAMARDVTDGLWVAAMADPIGGGYPQLKKVAADGTVLETWTPFGTTSITLLKTGPPLGPWPDATCDVFIGAITTPTASNDVTLELAVDNLVGGAIAHRIELLDNTTGHEVGIPKTDFLSNGPWSLGDFGANEKVVYRITRIDNMTISGTAVLRATNSLGEISDVLIQCAPAPTGHIPVRRLQTGYLTARVFPRPAFIRDGVRTVGGHP